MSREYGLTDGEPILVNLTPQPRSAIVLHRKTWGALTLPEPPAEVLRRPEVAFDCNGRVRFATVATVPKSALGGLVSRAGAFDLAVPVLLPKDIDVGDLAAQEWTITVLPPDACRKEPDFEWPAFASLIAELGGVCVRRTDDRAERTVTVDFFVADKLGEQIASAIADDDDVTRARHRSGR